MNGEDESIADILTGADSVKDPVEPEWVVRLVRRDNEDKWYFIDKSYNRNARLSSAVKMDKGTAVQLAKAINDGKIQFKANAMRYRVVKRKKEESKESSK